MVGKIMRLFQFVFLIPAIVLSIVVWNDYSDSMNRDGEKLFMNYVQDE